MRRVLTLVAWSLLVACAEKVPESKAARDLGNIPKQTIDQASTGVDAAIQRGADRIKEEEKK